MPLQPIGALLGATTELKALSARVRRLRELQKLYLGSAPRDLASASRVKSYQAGTLVVSADNAAVAAKLRQLAPSLTAALRQTAGEITKIRIEVQVSGRGAAGARRSRKHALTSEAVDEFQALADRVADGELKSALKRLVRHHKKSGTDSD